MTCGQDGEGDDKSKHGRGAQLKYYEQTDRGCPEDRGCPKLQSNFIQSFNMINMPMQLTFVKSTRTETEDGWAVPELS